MTTFSDRLRDKMNQKRITQSQLARRLSVTPTAVWNWENGNSTPRPRSAEKLASFLGVSVDWLLDGESLSSATESDEIESLEEEIIRLRDKVASLNGVDASNVEIKIEITSRIF